MATTVDRPVFGFTACRREGCGTAVLNEVAFKTGGLCANCYREDYNQILQPAVLRVDGQRVEVKRLSTNRRPGERKQRKRAKARKKATPEYQERNRLLMLAQGRARLRLQKIFPELYEILLADERAELGLEAWSLDRALTPFTAQSTLEFVRAYHRL